MSSPFQKAFSARSPLHNHGNKDIERAKKLSKKDGEDGDFNYESDKVMKLKTRGETKNASHADGGDEESNVDRNEIPDASALKKKTVASSTNSGILKTSPLNSYVSGSENIAEDFTGPMKDFFSSVEKNTVDFIDAEKESKKEKTKLFQNEFRKIKF